MQEQAMAGLQAACSDIPALTAATQDLHVRVTDFLRDTRQHATQLSVLGTPVRPLPAVSAYLLYKDSVQSAAPPCCECLPARDDIVAESCRCAVSMMFSGRLGLRQPPPLAAKFSAKLLQVATRSSSPAPQTCTERSTKG
eukprot:1156769-Pelagomonas_calceolata.AAC.6